MEDVPKMPSTEGEGVHDADHDDHFEETTLGYGRIRKSPEWFGNPVLSILLVEHDEPAT
jgi:hypothetical protein